jgi:hypothetical protein
MSAMNDESNRHKVAINLSINIIRKWSIENLAHSFCSLEQCMVRLSYFKRSADRQRSLECGHRERERIAFAKSNRQTNEAEIQIKRWEISDYTNITTISSLFSVSLSLFLLSRYGCFNGGRMAIPTDIDIPLRLICHFQRKTPDRNVCPYVSLVPLNLFVHRNPCGNTRRLRRHSVHM